MNNKYTKVSFIIILATLLSLQLSLGAKDSDKPLSIEDQFKNEFMKDMKLRYTSTDEILKTPYFNSMFGIRESFLQFRIKMAFCYLEPRVLYYPLYAHSTNLSVSDILSNPPPIPYGYGAEFGIRAREIPAVLTDTIVFILTLGLVVASSDDSSSSKGSHYYGAGYDLRDMHWYNDFYLYAGVYGSDKSFDGREYKQLSETETIRVTGMRICNYQRIRIDAFEEKKYYTTPGNINSQNGFKIEYWEKDDSTLWVVDSVGKINREADLNIGLFFRGELGNYGIGTTDNILSSMLALGFSYFTETKSFRQVYRIGYAWKTTTDLLYSGEEKKGPYLDVAFQF